MLPYTYVPGRAPHPIRAADGHRLGGFESIQPRLDLDAWQQCDGYRHAVRLFNAGFYWEAHEVWEGSWHAAGRRGRTADFLKALIKLAAALVKAREGQLNGVHRHSNRAGELLQIVADKHRWDDPDYRLAGLRLVQLRSVIESLQSTDASWLEQQVATSVTEVAPIVESLELEAA